MLYDQLRPDERMLIESAKKKGVELQLFDVEKLHLNVTSLKDSSLFPTVVLQRCISYYRGLHIAAVLEAKGVTVINSHKAAANCGDKLLCSICLAKAGIPTPKTFVAFTTEAALTALNEIGYPAILKPVVGSWGRLIAPLKDAESAMAILESREYMSPIQQVYYIQEKVDRPARDIRCFVAGKRAVAAMYRYSSEWDWRTNAARGGTVEPCKITGKLEELSVKAAEAVGGGAFGVDLMESPSGLVVHEVNYTTEFKHLAEATGVDVAGALIEYSLEQAEN